MEDRLPVLLAGTIGGVCLYEFDGEYEVYEGDHCTIFDNEEDARAYYEVACVFPLDLCNKLRKV